MIERRSPDDTVEVRLSFWPFAFGIAVPLGLLILAFLFFPDVKGRAELIFILIFLTVVSLPYSLFQLSKTDAAYILSRDGVDDRRSRIGLIRWEDVSSYSVENTTKRYYLVLRFSEEAMEKYRIQFSGRKWLDKIIHFGGARSIKLNFASTDLSADDLINFVEQYAPSDESDEA